MTLVNYRPFNADSDDLPSGLRLFNDSVARMFSEPGTRPWSPSVDIIENENDLVLKADVPGIDAANIHISMENGTLTLKGERKFENSENRQGYHRIERSYGTFARSFALPNTVDVEKVKADFKNGVLTVTLPKMEIAKPRSVKVEIQQ
ncbi:MAG: Hsp20/alpha crystallin family protein [Bryobacteraceae bacterium]